MKDIKQHAVAEYEVIVEMVLFLECFKNYGLGLI